MRACELPLSLYSFLSGARRLRFHCTAVSSASLPPSFLPVSLSFRRTQKSSPKGALASVFHCCLSCCLTVMFVVMFVVLSVRAVCRAVCSRCMLLCPAFVSVCRVRLCVCAEACPEAMSAPVVIKECLCCIVCISDAAMHTDAVPDTMKTMYLRCFTAEFLMRDTLPECLPESRAA